MPKTQRRHSHLPTELQVEQRQLSWLLYITEGYIANVHAALVQGYGLSRKQKDLMGGAVLTANLTAQAIRSAMRRLRG